MKTILDEEIQKVLAEMPQSQIAPILTNPRVAIFNAIKEDMQKYYQVPNIRALFRLLPPEDQERLQLEYKKILSSKALMICGNLSTMTKNNVPKDDLFMAVKNMMLSIVTSQHQFASHLTQGFGPPTLYQIPFSRFDFEEQCELLQEYYRCNHDKSNPLIFSLLYDYERNSTRNIIVSNADNWQYLTALRNASKGFSSRSSNMQTVVVFQNETICDFLRSIGCLEATVINAPCNNAWERIRKKTNDKQIEELCELKIIASHLNISLSYDMETTSFKMKHILHSYDPFSPIQSLIDEQNAIRDKTVSRYLEKMPEKLRNALMNDDASSFMINLCISNRKICQSLLSFAAINGKYNIMKELIDKYPDKCKDVIPLLLEHGNNTQIIIDLLTLLESKLPGIVRSTLDEKGCNLLWHVFYHESERYKFKTDLQKMEKFLLSCGCDAENKFHGFTYRHFRDLVDKYKIGE